MSPTDSLLNNLWCNSEGGYTARLCDLQTYQTKTMVLTSDPFPFKEAEQEKNEDGSIIAWHFDHENGNRYTVENLGD